MEQPQHLHLIMEYADQSTGIDIYVKKFPAKRLVEAEACYFLLQIAEALSYCKWKQVVHRDIKLENILIDQNSSVKLIDFGFSIVIAENQKLNVFCGTPSYMAPEIVNKQEYDFGVDIWALGVLFYKIVTGNFPFRGIFVKNIARTRR